MRSLAQRVIVAGMLGLGFCSVPAEACDCITLTLKRAFLVSDEVFVATVLDERGFTRTDPYDYAGVRQIFVPTVVTVRVDRRFLGPQLATRDVGLDSCGVLVKGRSYLVFASWVDDERLQNHGCLSRPLDRAGSEIRTIRRRAWLWRIERRVFNWWQRIL